ETDKADMELEAYDEGVLAELRVEEGATVPVGAVIAVLAAPGETVAAAPAPKPLAARAESPRPTLVRRAEPAAAAAAQRPRASPLARRIAEEHGVDLAAITGTGTGGLIVERDVRAAVAGAAGPAPPAEAPSGAKRIELGRMRRTTARRMAEAKRDVPHFYVT